MTSSFQIPQQAYGEKLNKYLELTEEIKKMWRQDRVLMVPLVMSATAVVPRTLLKNQKELGIHSWNNTIIIEAIISAVYSRCIVQNKPPSKGAKRRIIIIKY